VLLIPVLALIVHRVGQGLDLSERQWFYGLLAVAVALRLLAIAALFLTADSDKPYATLFGDEELFKSRSLWLRNIGLGIPISPADFIYAVEETGKSSYLFVLAYLSALVGDIPFGVHVLNTTLYVAGVCLTYWLVRPSYGRVASLAGLATLLFLPTLFLWSISALKEPLYALVAAAELVCAMHIVRSARWRWRVAALAGVIALGVTLEGLRRGALLIAGLGTVGGLSAGLVISRPRLAMATAVALPVVVMVLATRPSVHDRVLSVVRGAATNHVGHVFTPGYSYKTLDPWYYIDPADIRRMPAGDSAKFVVRSMTSYVTEPLPWRIESRTMLVYLPEYVVWLVLAGLVPIGIVAGLRRDALLTAVLAAHAFAVAFVIAVTSGNVGTLVRHRGLVLPYMAWLSMLGACHLVCRFAPASQRGSVDQRNGDR